MTERVKGCWVAFEEDIRVDDAEGLVNAIKRLRGVLDVNLEPVKASDYFERSRIGHELATKVINVLYGKA